MRHEATIYVWRSKLVDERLDLRELVMLPCVASASWDGERWARWSVAINGREMAEGKAALRLTEQDEAEAKLHIARLAVAGPEAA